MFDPGTKGCSSLLHPEMATWQGPALYIYNDSTFSAADYRNLSQIGQGSKLDKMGATGRFGLGFNAVYHFTDVPSFVSGDHLVFFDPHCRYLPNTSASSPGLKIKLSQSQLLSQFPDQFQPYTHFGCTCQGRFEGTLFRFPLRSPSAAKVSEIKSKPCTPEDVQELLEAFKADAANALLFLKHVKRITIHQIDAESGTKTEAFSAVHANADDATQEQQERIPQFVCGTAARPLAKNDFYRKLQGIDEQDLPTSLYEKHIVVTTDTGEQENSRWLISSALGGGKARDLALQSVDGPYQLRLVPWAGIAARLSSPKASLVGRAYCFLPLPTLVGLPVHVNGSFELSANRRDIWHGSDMTGEGQIRSQWNVALLHDVVAPCYARLLERASTIVGNEQYCGLWPTKMGAEPWQTLVRSLYEVGMARSILHTELDGGRWLPPLEAVLADVNADNCDELTRLMLLEGIPVADPPLHIRRMLLAAQEQPLKQLTPCLVRQALRVKGVEHHSLSERKDALVLLRYCCNDLEGAEFAELGGLPLIPTAASTLATFQKVTEQGQAKSYKSERGKGHMYTCTQLEYDLLLESQAPVLVDRSIPDDLYAMLASQPLQQSCSVRTLNPQLLARLFDMGTLPAAWKRSAEVQWSGSGTGEPSREWVQMFWRYVDECHQCPADLACFEDWPLLPCVGGVLRRLIKETSVIDIGNAEVELASVLASLGCSSIDNQLVDIEGPALAAYVNQCTADGVISSISAALGSESSRGISTMASLSIDMKRTLRGFIGREHANGWRPSDEQLELLRVWPVYEAHSVEAVNDTVAVDLRDHRWLPPQGAARELLDARCLKLVQAEDASLYECLQIRVASEPVFLSEFVFPLRLHQLPETQQDTTMLGVLRALPRLQQADPQFQARLSDVAFVPTGCGARRKPAELYHPDLKDIVAELLSVEECLPVGPFALASILVACELLGLRTVVDRLTLLESAKSVPELAPPAAHRRGQALLRYLDGNFEALSRASSLIVQLKAISSLERNLGVSQFFPVQNHGMPRSSATACSNCACRSRESLYMKSDRASYSTSRQADICGANSARCTSDSMPRNVAES
eukprot:SAG25_NODE_911_length_4794_cov_1.302449_1_plen_1090_part_00